MVRFVVDRIEEKIAVLMTDDHYVIEFPAELLPPETRESHVLDFEITRNVEDENRRKDRIRSLQDELIERTRREDEQ